MTQFCPALISDFGVPPGETAVEAFEELGFTVVEGAELLGWSLERFQDLVEGELELDGEIAFELEQILGIPIRLWMNLERDYRHWRNGTGPWA